MARPPDRVNEGPGVIERADGHSGELVLRRSPAGLYTEAGVRRAAASLRPGGAAVIWSPARYPAFESLLRRVFPRVEVEVAHDLVDGRRHEYAMYVGLPSARG